MMQHRKNKHSSQVKTCLRYSENQCGRKAESCWFKHELQAEFKEINENVAEHEKDNQDKVFREVTEDLDPPINQKD